MSESIFETFTDERGNISVRISQEVQVLTREEANRIEAEYRRMQAKNAKLRELVRDMAECMDNSQPRCKKCKFRELNCQWFKFDDRMRELRVEVQQ